MDTATGLHNELDGILVVSLEQAVAAPYCGLLLADAGARVLKVERPEGDFARGYDDGAGGQSAIFAWLNRGKESICIDLNKAKDAQILRLMLTKADVLLSNLAPGSLKRRGLTGDTLRTSNPGLITCSISGYGETGIAAGKKAYDFLVQGESGISAVTGTEESPARVGIPLTDLSSGLTAFSAILRALIQRVKTGRGIDINLAMFDVMADWMNMPLLAHRYSGGAPARSGLKHTFIAPYGAFSCGDGTQVLLSIQNNREWAVFCERILKHPELVSDPRFASNTNRYANRQIVDEMVTKAFAAHAARDVMVMLDDARIANAQLNSVAQLSDHPLIRNSDALIDQELVSVAGLPVRSVGEFKADVPQLDEHGVAIRKEFAISTEDDAVV